MKRNLSAIVILLTCVLAVLVAAEAVFAQGKGKGRGRKAEQESKTVEQAPQGPAEPNRARPRRRGPMRPEALAEEGDRIRQRRSEQLLKPIKQDITDLKEGRGQFIAELKAIHALAVKEKAAKTARQLEQLIAKQQKRFDKDLGKLEQRRERLKTMFQERAERKGEPAKGGRRRGQPLGREGLLRRRGAEGRPRRPAPASPDARRGGGRRPPEPEEE